MKWDNQMEVIQAKTQNVGTEYKMDAFFGGLNSEGS